MLLDLAERSLVDGSQTTITLHRDTDEGVCVVRAANRNGESVALFDNGAEALEAFNHPFSKVEWLDYPTAANRKSNVPVSAYAEAITAEMSA
jgi:hypothetical protein